MTFQLSKDMPMFVGFHGFVGGKCPFSRRSPHRKVLVDELDILYFKHQKTVAIVLLQKHLNEFR